MNDIREEWIAPLTEAIIQQELEDEDGETEREIMQDYQAMVNAPEGEWHNHVNTMPTLEQNRDIRYDLFELWPNRPVGFTWYARTLTLWLIGNERPFPSIYDRDEEVIRRAELEVERAMRLHDEPEEEII